MKSSVLILAACMIIIPLALGELYPFTIAPMFRDAPARYCNYKITGPDGKVYSNLDFALQRNYDGNPVGMGAGIVPPSTVDTFGAVPSGEEIRMHLRPILQQNFPDLQYIDVVQTVFAGRADGRFGLTQTNKLRVIP